MRILLLPAVTASVLIWSGAALADASCSVDCEKGSCTYEIRDSNGAKAGGVLKQTETVRYFYKEQPPISRTMERQTDMGVAMLAARAEIESTLPEAGPILDELEKALVEGDKGAIHHARYAVYRAYRAAGLNVPTQLRPEGIPNKQDRAKVNDNEEVDCYCDSGGYPVCEKV